MRNESNLMAQAHLLIRACEYDRARQILEQIAHQPAAQIALAHLEETASRQRHSQLTSYIMVIMMLILLISVMLISVL